MRDVGVARERTDHETSPLFADLAQCQRGEIDHRGRSHDLEAQQIDHGGAAGEIRGVGTRRLDRGLDGGRARVLERLHVRTFRAAWIAATMFGYAPHRHRLPLIWSRTSSSVVAVPSASNATALMI